MTFRDLKLRVRALVAPRRSEGELDEELAFHVERETAKLVEGGLSPDEARTQARTRFGSVALSADECRDARGTAFVDNTARDILHAFRTFRRAPLAALTIVLTVGLGLSLVGIVFTFYNMFFLRVDAVRNSGEVFAVLRLPNAGATNAWIRSTRPDYEALRTETDVFTGVAALRRGVGTRIDGHAVNGTLVTGNFFQMLGVTASLGRPLLPADDDRFAPQPVIVLSHRGWKKLLAGDPSAVGRRLQINGSPFEVVGVMPEDFRGLSLGPPDYWAPLGLGGQLRRTEAGREDEIEIEIVGRLKPAMSKDTAAARLAVWASERTPDGRPGYVRLRPSQGTVGEGAGEALLVFSPAFFAFGLILLIGCANVANLLLARGLSRQREIGVRLALGASRRRVVRQLLTESLLLALAAAVCAWGMSRVLLGTALQLAIATMPPEIAEHVGLAVPPSDWRVLLFLLGGALAATIVFGLAPALQATRLELVRTMRGEVTRDARPGRARHALIAVQVGASALLLIAAAVFLRSSLTASTADAGVRTTDTIAVEIANEPLRPELVQAVSAHHSVAGVAATWPGALGQPDSTWASVADVPGRLGVSYRFVSPEYFGLLDIDLVRGRGFMPAERNPDAGAVIVSESAARRLWPDRDATGQIVRLEAAMSPGRPGEGPPALPAGTYAVVGVARDVRSALRMYGELPAAIVYVPIAPETPGTSLVLRVHGDPRHARLALLDRLTQIDPALGEVTTMRTTAGLEAYILGIVFWVTVVLGGLALALTLSGLFSVLSYVVAQRTKEIGVRMALGASAREVARLVVIQSARPVLFGLAAGAAAALGLATMLMTTPAAATIGGVVRVFDPAAYGASLLLILTACLLAALIPARRAARIDPIATLRQD